MPLTQVCYFALALRQILVLVGRGWVFRAAIAGIGLLLVIAVAASVSLVLITEVLALLSLPVTRSYPRSWGRASAVTHHLAIPLLLVGAATSISRAD